MFTEFNTGRFITVIKTLLLTSRPEVAMGSMTPVSVCVT
jgi:hypothetical protein